MHTPCFRVKLWINMFHFIIKWIGTYPEYTFRICTVLNFKPSWSNIFVFFYLIILVGYIRKVHWGY